MRTDAHAHQAPHDGASAPLMARNRYYHSAHWLKLRGQALARDHSRCVIPGCGDPGTHVDHIKTRPNVDHPTAADVLANLRTLCSTHDAQLKERGDGSRAAKATVKGCDADGWPLDPVHPWSRP